MQPVFSASPKDTAWFDMVHRSVLCHVLLLTRMQGQSDNRDAVGYPIEEPYRTGQWYRSYLLEMILVGNHNGGT